jgi:hypothetical protein
MKGRKRMRKGAASLPESMVMKKPYTQETAVISNNNVGKFERPEWHRDWREGHVSVIRNALLRGYHFSENITVNVVNGNYRVLNGNHRIRAVREIIQNHSQFKVECTLTKYKGLTKEEEVEVYDVVNNTKRESGLDKLKAHCLNSEFVKLATKRFPCKVLFRGRSASETNALPINVVVSSYIGKGNLGFFSGASSEFAERINTLDEDDYDKIAKFHQFFKDVFGDFNSGNLYANYNFINVFGKIYYNSVGIDVTKDEMAKRLRKLMSKYTGQIQMFSQGGVSMHKELYNFLVDKLSYRKRLFNVFEAAKDGKQEAT